MRRASLRKASLALAKDEKLSERDGAPSDEPPTLKAVSALPSENEERPRKRASKK